MNIKIIVIGIFMFMTTPCYSADLLSIENEFIKLIVNNSDSDKGRFSIETTLGDPSHTRDDNQLLIFGKPQPWTSYTTIQIDDTPYIFGGLSNRTGDRTGKTFHFGEFISQSIDTENQSIQSLSKIGPLKVVQTLSFLVNPQTLLPDTSLISYTLINEDSVAHRAGVRLMLDTKLGQNDGAPFRIGDEAYTSEIQFSHQDIVDYWLAFDQFESPNIIAQGILNYPELGVQPPNKLLLANWGTLSDNPWTVPYEKGRSFVREGELETDTALALYWDPTLLQPGESRSFHTAYGLGGLTISLGQLSLGLTAPKEIFKDTSHSFLVVGYVTNSTEYVAENTRATFLIPEGFEIIEGQASYAFNSLSPGELKQLPIRIALKDGGSHASLSTLSLKVSADRLDDNALSRTIQTISDSIITGALQAISADTLSPFIDLTLSLKNDSNLALSSLDISLDLPSELQCPSWESPQKSIQHLAPKTSKTLHWKLKQTAGLSAPLNAHITAGTITSKTIVLPADTLPMPTTAYSLTSSLTTPKLTDYFFVSIQQEGLKEAKGESLSFELEFNPEHLELTRISVPMINENNPPIEALYEGMLQLRAISFDLLTPSSIHFKPRKQTETTLYLKQNGRLIDSLTLTISDTHFEPFFNLGD